MRQGSFDFEWGSFLRARAAGEAATGSHEVTTAALDGHATKTETEMRGMGSPPEPFVPLAVARAARQHENSGCQRGGCTEQRPWLLQPHTVGPAHTITSKW